LGGLSYSRGKAFFLGHSKKGKGKGRNLKEGEKRRPTCQWGEEGGGNNAPKGGICIWGESGGAIMFKYNAKELRHEWSERGEGKKRTFLYQYNRENCWNMSGERVFCRIERV